MDSLGARRRQSNRAALIKAAVDLFESSGVDDTTLEQVAARASLHVQTLYRHFPSKKELAAAINQDYFDRFQAEMEQRAPKLDTLTLWRDWVDRSCSEMTRGGEERYRKRLRKFWATPTLWMSLVHVWYQYEDLLTSELAADLGMDPERDPLPRMLACTLWAGNVSAARRWAHGRAKQTLNQACVAVVDDAIELLGAQLKKRKSPRRSRA
jgi:AcrR family transcriptional regulator